MKLEKIAKAIADGYNKSERNTNPIIMYGELSEILLKYVIPLVNTNILITDKDMSSTDTNDFYMVSCDADDIDLYMGITLLDKIENCNGRNSYTTEHFLEGIYVGCGLEEGCRDCEYGLVKHIKIKGVHKDKIEELYVCRYQNE